MAYLLMLLGAELNRVKHSFTDAIAIMNVGSGFHLLKITHMIKTATNSPTKKLKNNIIIKLEMGPLSLKAHSLV